MMHLLLDERVPTLAHHWHTAQLIHLFGYLLTRFYIEHDAGTGVGWQDVIDEGQ